MKNNILEIRNLSKIYQNKTSEILAISDINLDVKDKEFVSIVGPSGCGKSTILGIISGLISKSKGYIKYKNNNITLGYMFQTDTLFEWLTVYENCILGLKIQKKLTSDNINYVNYLINKYGLSNFIDNYPSNLSGGMRQRVALIRTLAIKPDILLLDEPFSALDYQNRLQVSQDVYNIIKEEKITAIMITHDIEEAISLSDSIIVLTNNPGKIKKNYQIIRDNKNPIEFRNTKQFIEYRNSIWKDMGINV